MIITEYNNEKLTALVCGELVEQFLMSPSETGLVDVQLVSVETNKDQTETFNVSVVSNDVDYQYSCLFDVVSNEIIDIVLCVE